MLHIKQQEKINIETTAKQNGKPINNDSDLETEAEKESESFPTELLINLGAESDADPGEDIVKQLEKPQAKRF